MKKIFSELAYYAEPETLEDLFGIIKPEKVSGSVLSSIRERVTGKVPDKKTGRLVKFVLPAAACLVVVFAALFFAGFIGRPALPDGAIKLNVRKETTDRIAVNRELPKGSYLSPSDDYFGYVGLSFYEVNGMTYMYYYENGPIYTFDGDSFADTGKTVKHSYVLSVKADDGFGYFGGVFYSGGRIEPVDIISPDLNYYGLFRVDLLTGKEERYVETADYVTSVAVNGTKVYYVTCTEFDSNYYYIDMSKYPDARFSLKCVDTVTGEILNMIPDSDQAIKILGYQDGRLYFFRSAALDPKTLELCFIDSNDLLFALPVTYPNDTLCYPVVFSDSWIFIRSIRSYSVTEDGGEDQVRFDMIEAVDVYDLDGNKIGDTSADFCHVRKSSIKNYLITDDSSKRFERWGGDDLAIYGGKIVSYSAEGFYLDDPKSRSSQKIIDRTEVLSEKENAKYSDPSIEIADYLRYYFFTGTSKTVYNGKLYILIEVPLELINVSLNNPYSQAFEKYFNFCPRIVEYDGADVRLFDINPANASR